MAGEGPDSINRDVTKDDDEVDDKEVSVDEDGVVGVFVAEVPDQHHEGRDVGEDR